MPSDRPETTGWQPPGYWKHEISGVLRPAVEAYLTGGDMSQEHVAAMRAYLRQWIASPSLTHEKARSGTTDLQRFEEGFTGHGRGVVVSNDGSGSFSERPMTFAEREARVWALSIADGVNDLYRRGCNAFVYHRVWELTALAIAQARDQGYRAGWDAARAEATDGRSLIPEA